MVPNLIRAKGQYINNKPNLLKSIVKFSKHMLFHLRQFPHCSMVTLYGNGNAGHEITPNTVANATKIIVLATKIQKLVAKLATRTL